MLDRGAPSLRDDRMPKQAIKEWVQTQLWDQVPVNIAVIDRNFRIVQANRSFVKNYGLWQNRF